MSDLQSDDTFGIILNPNSRAREGAPAFVARQGQGVATHNTLNAFSDPVILEYEDAYFHHNSAVMMPDVDQDPGDEETQPSNAEDAAFMELLRNSQPDTFASFHEIEFDPDDADSDPSRRSGLGVLATAYRFAQLNTSHRLLLAGHADTSGETNYNYELSKLRALNVLHLLLGEREQWIDICVAKSKVEDYQRILKHCARRFGFGCDPGAVDNEDGPATETALRSFQDHYNARFGKSIAVDGKVGRETWGAFFDVYIDELASMLETTADGLDSFRQALQFVADDQKFISCGESTPIDQPDRQNFRSAENRRVELIFFPLAFLPALSCHASTQPFCQKQCSRAECGVYSPGRYEFNFLDPSLSGGRVIGGQYQPSFAINDTGHDLTLLFDQPDDAYSSEMALSDEPDRSEDPIDQMWAFLEPFDDLDPPVGIGEIKPNGPEGLGEVA
jgi:outer membrane protein OmpA-like peptidoglycan-associated protein